MLAVKISTKPRFGDVAFPCENEKWPFSGALRIRQVHVDLGVLSLESCVSCLYLVCLLQYELPMAETKRFGLSL